MVDGLFRVELDFGASALDDERARWLQTSVVPAQPAARPLLPVGSRSYLSSLPVVGADQPGPTWPRGLAGGLIAISPAVNNCIQGTMGTDCSDLYPIVVTVREGQPVWLDAATSMGTISFELEKLPRVGGPEVEGVIVTVDAAAYAPGATKARLTVGVAIGTGFSVVMMALASWGIINPLMGALLHNAGALFVIMNSSRVMRFLQTRDELAALEEEWRVVAVGSADGEATAASAGSTPVAA